MAESYLTLTNKVLARLNEVQLTSTSFATARGIQVQAQNAVMYHLRHLGNKNFAFMSQKVMIPSQSSYGEK